MRNRCQEDPSGHGTHVAGIIAAGLDNGQHIAGLAQVTVNAVPTVSLLGTAWSSQVASDLLAASEAGANVTSISLAGECHLGDRNLCPELQAAIDRAWTQDGVIVAASGNGGSDHAVAEPASMDHVLAVGSVGPDREFSGFSNEGAPSTLSRRARTSSPQPPSRAYDAAPSPTACARFPARVRPPRT